jgi:hypothetical protein
MWMARSTPSTIAARTKGRRSQMGASMGCIVTCAVHGMKVNVIAQREERIGMNVRTFPVELRADGLYVDIQAPATSVSPAS